MSAASKTSVLLYPPLRYIHQVCHVQHIHCAHHAHCVCHIHQSLRIPQPKASRHLAYLRRAGLVDTRRDGLWVHYRMASLTDPVLGAIGEAVRHALTHVDVVQRDAQRLQKKTGCCLPVVGEWQAQSAQSAMRATTPSPRGIRL